MNNARKNFDKMELGSLFRYIYSNDPQCTYTGIKVKENMILILKSWRREMDGDFLNVEGYYEAKIYEMIKLV